MFCLLRASGVFVRVSFFLSGVSGGLGNLLLVGVDLSFIFRRFLRVDRALAAALVAST
ncbi:MAG: hypothetical protein U1G07_15660 [Verrucomicrobiota bacterium]